MRWIAMIAAVLIGGCTSQSGVIPDGPDAYRVMIAGKTGFTPTGKLKIVAYRQANAFCARSGKKAETITNSSVENGFLRFPSADIRFRCVGP